MLALLASLGGGACSDRYGTYITVTTSDPTLAFDHIELYFGLAIGDRVPTSPQHLEPDPGEPQLLLTRVMAPTDIATFAQRETEYTLWIPDGGENDDLGAYVLAIGSANGQRVAIGELFDFEVTTERVVQKYSLALSAYDASQIEEWGRAGDPVACLRYSKPREKPLSTIAIVPHEDVDCDGFLDADPNGASDCEPLLYCDGSGGGGCLGSQPCVRDSNACGVGVCRNKDGASATCEATTCVADILCDECDLTQSPASILDCALLSTATHPSSDLKVPVRATQQLCSDPTTILIELPFACAQPQIDAVTYFMAGDAFRFDIASSPTDAKTCVLTISGAPMAQFSGVPHLLISLDGAGGRFAFVLGLTANVEGCPTPGATVRRSYSPNVGDCVR